MKFRGLESWTTISHNYLKTTLIELFNKPKKTIIFNATGYLLHNVNDKSVCVPIPSLCVTAALF